MRNSFSIFFLAFTLLSTFADDWPQWLGPKRDGIWRETGIIERFATNKLVRQWTTPIGAGYSGPAVADGRVYAMGRRLSLGATNPSDPFAKGSIPGTERVFCLRESDGTVLWQHEYDCPYTASYPAGPRTTPLVAKGCVFTLGTEGNLFCFETNRGKILWSRDLKKDYGIPTPLWGFSAHPLLDGNKLICLVGGTNSTVVAFDYKSGAEIWRALSSKEPGYCPPVIFETGGKRQLIVWHPESLNSLDPETGALYWSEPFKVQMGLTISTPRKSGDFLFVTAFYNGARMYKFDRDHPAASLVWQSKKNSERDTDALHSIISTPFFDKDYIYGVCSYGQLRCLKAETGERIWETFAATTAGKEVRWANAFLIPNGDRYFIFNETGDLIIANLSPKGYEEISRAHLLDPTNPSPGRDVLWSHPAFANGCIFARNDREIICVSLRKDGVNGGNSKKD